MKKLSLLLLLAALFLLAPAAQAQLDTCGDQGDCTFNRDYSDVQNTGGGGGYVACSRSDGCFVCTVDTHRCALVVVSEGACKCMNVPAGAPNITTCTPEGHCYYFP